MVKKVIMIFSLLVTSYVVSWYFWGHKCLLEKGIDIINVEGIIKLHSDNEIIIIPKYEGEIVKHIFSSKIPNKTIKNLENNAEEMRFLSKIVNNVDNGAMEIHGIEINITKNNILWAALDFRVYPNDIRSRETYVLWAFFDWIQIGT